MRVRMTRPIASPDFSYKKGQVVDLPSDLAEKFCSTGQAEKVEPEPRSGKVRETASSGPPETGVAPPPVRKRKGV